MSFYQSISPYYDAIFPVDATEMSFVATLLTGRKHLLDMGCGTGNKTVHVAHTVEHITAFDLDADMIATAKVDNARPNITYMELDMTAVDTAFAGQRFDCALCLGNTLVHVIRPGGIAALLRKTHALLQPGALFLLQILNYDRILDYKITELPVLDSGEAVFTRRYAPQDGLLRFITSLTVKKSGATFVNDIPLCPMRKADLAEALAGAGFSETAWYGNYEGAPHTPDSFMTIALCRA